MHIKARIAQVVQAGTACCIQVFFYLQVRYFLFSVVCGLAFGTRCEADSSFISFCFFCSSMPGNAAGAWNWAFARIWCRRLIVNRDIHHFTHRFRGVVLE
jgi:hypothetical protein